DAASELRAATSHSAVERLDVRDLAVTRQPERDERIPGPAAHGGDVADVLSQRLPPQLFPRGSSEVKMDVLDQRIGRCEGERARRRAPHGRIVADANDEVRTGLRTERARKPIDQREFTDFGDTHNSLPNVRTLSMRL